MLRSSLLAGFMTIALSLPALAESPADLATQHINAIASGDVGKITATYSADSSLNWVGGPLNGTYVGPTQLDGVWTKFAHQAPLKVSVYDMKENANPAGTTVTADVIFQGKATIKVHYVLLYRAGALVDEIWQIDPKLSY